MGRANSHNAVRITPLRSKAVDLETARLLARIRKLEATYTGKGVGSRIAEQVGTDRRNISRIRNGKRHKNSISPLNELGLRYSSKLCPKCGNVCGIVCMSSRCIVCEFRELAKEGIVKIEKESC